MTRELEGEILFAPRDARAKKLMPKRVKMPPDLAAELRQADEDFARRDYIELTRAQLDRAVRDGRVSVAGRVLRLSTTFRRTLDKLGVRPRSKALRPCTDLVTS